VRDYECDSGNGVNSAVFLNYLESDRYEFLRNELRWFPRMNIPWSWCIRARCCVAPRLC